MSKLIFNFESYWHAGTGRGLGAVADAVCARDDSHLPYLPGRTVKGLLRAACAVAEKAGQLSSGRTEELFGSSLAVAGFDDDVSETVIDRALEQARYTTTPGILRFSSATLGPEWQRWGREAGGKNPYLPHLFSIVASTSLDEDGVAKDHTLRSIEVAVPMTLTAPVECLADDPAWTRDLKKVLPLVHSAGSHRNRGFGRVSLTLEVN